jgi:threonine/homoserine/homoserine lactone efflux protein
VFPPDKLVLFVLAAAALALAPGPNMAYMLSRAVSQGRRAGVVSLLGVESGFLVHLLAVASGLTAILLAVPYAYDALRLFGAAYLLYLAWQMVRSRGGSFDPGREALDTTRKLYGAGFLSNALNPKTAIFYLSVFPQFVDPARGTVFAQSIALGLLHIAVSTACNLAVVLAASSGSAWLTGRPAWRRLQRSVFGVVLAGFALRLALDDRR